MQTKDQLEQLNNWGDEIVALSSSAANRVLSAGMISIATVIVHLLWTAFCLTPLADAVMSEPLQAAIFVSTLCLMIMAGIDAIRKDQKAVSLHREVELFGIECNEMRRLIRTSKFKEQNDEFFEECKRHYFNIVRHYGRNSC